MDQIYENRSKRKSITWKVYTAHVRKGENSGDHRRTNTQQQTPSEVTLATEAGVSDRVWTFRELLAA